MIRKMTAEDATEVLQLEKDCFSRPWSEKDLAYEFSENPYSQIYVMEENGKIVGYYDMWVIFENAELARLAVDPKCRRKGYGWQLLEHCQKTAMEMGCETIGLEVRVSNDGAIALYRKADFTVINLKKMYYETEDGLRMMKGI
ncbi:MAG: ribosomal protein S18-alanine N-acetyltransferase [Erysipelotrichaceae bacterium]|nr:ribosomal protein S18-alanine N-acetyltransferase [Erysipelotrichaceae bacterium]